MARAVIECAADAIVAFGTDRTVMLWNPAAERMFGWTAAEVVGLEPQIIPEELKAEHNAVLERVRGGGQISFATRRIRKDSTVIDVRIDTSALTDGAGEVTGWVNVCHQAGEDDVARHYMAERARVVRRLGDVVADMNAQRDLESVLDRIAASLRELTSADAGGFVIIEEDMLRLVSTAGLPARLRGRTAALSASLVGELMGSGKTVMMATGESGGFDDLIWSALPGLHTIALSLSHVAGKPYGALYALYSRRKLSHVELELLELLAGHAGVALTNAMAFEEVVRQRAHERAVIDGSADGIAVLDEAGLVRQWNPAAHRITGIPGPDAIGKPPPFPLPEPDAMLNYKLPNGRWLDVLCTALADERRAGHRLPRRHRGQGARGGQGPVPGHHESRAAHADHRGAGLRQHAGQPVGPARRRRTPGRGADHRRAGRLAGQAGRAAAARLAGRGRPASGQQRPVRPRRGAARRRHRVPAAVGQAHGRGRHPRRPAGRQRRHDGHRHHRRAAAGERVQVLTRRRHRRRAGPA